MSCNNHICKFDTRSFLHGPISKDEADALLLADGGADDSGRFLFREKKVCFGSNIIFEQAATLRTFAKWPSWVSLLERIDYTTGSCSTLWRRVVFMSTG